MRRGGLGVEIGGKEWQGKGLCSEEGVDPKGTNVHQDPILSF